MNLKYHQWPMDDGTLIHVEIQEQNKPRWMIITHGLGEHGGRHHHLRNPFSDHYNLVWWDLRGHGKSQGRRCFIDKFEQYANDLQTILQRLVTDYHMERYVLFGHSMGGLITADFMQNLAPHFLLQPEKVFLSSPPVSLPGPAGYLIKYAPVEVLNRLGSMPLSLAIPGLINPKGLSHDPKVDQDYINDPLNCRALHTRLAFNLCLRAREVFSRPLRLRCPSYCVYGSQDPIVDPEAIGDYFARLEKNTEILMIPEGRHELHNETPEYRKPYYDFLVKSLSPSSQELT